MLLSMLLEVTRREMGLGGAWLLVSVFFMMWEMYSLENEERGPEGEQERLK